MKLPWKVKDRAGGRLTVRVASASDASEFLEHTYRIVTETRFMLQCGRDRLPSVEEQRELFDHARRAGNSVYLIAERRRRPRGRRIVASGACLGGRTARTRHLCTLGMGVDETDWGRGIGGLILDAALTWARANPMLTRMSLQVFEENEAARHLYESRSFVVEGAMLGEALVGSRYETLIGMSVDVSR